MAKGGFYSEDLFSPCKETDPENDHSWSSAFEKPPDDKDFNDKTLPPPQNLTSSTMKNQSPGRILKPDERKEWAKKIGSAMSSKSFADLECFAEYTDDLVDLYRFSGDNQNQTGEWLNEYGITRKLVMLLEPSILHPDGDDDGQNIFLTTLKVCMNFAEACPAFSMELLSHGIVDILSTSLKHASMSSEKTSSDQLLLQICILHYIATQCRWDDTHFVEARTSQALRKFSSHEIDDIKFTSVLTMGYICRDQAIKRLLIQAEEIVTICIKWLNGGIDNKRICLQPWAIISGLTKLAINDQMSLELKRTELIQCVSHVMRTTVSSKERTACIEFLKATNANISGIRSSEIITKQASEPTDESGSTQKSFSSEHHKMRTTKTDKIVRYFDNLRKVDVILVGKTGNGKSALGNQIIGRKEFKSSADSSSATREVQFEFVSFENCLIKVVDAPGVSDTDGIRHIQRATENFVRKMQDAVILSPAGYHAFLLVVKYGNRFTVEDFACIKILKNIFGEDFVKNYCILLLTCGDNFKEENENLSFKEWCQQQIGAFKELLTECNNKVVLFDNKSKDESIRQEQIKELLSVIDSMPFAGQRYTDKHFQMAAAGREKLLLESKEPMLSEATVKKVSLFIQELDKPQKGKEEDQKEKLADLSERAQDLHRQILKLDNGTGVLKKSIETTTTLVKTIADRIHSLDRLLAERRHHIQKQEDVKRMYQTKFKNQEQELEKLGLEKSTNGASDLEREKNMRQKHDARIALIAEREYKEKQTFQNKCNELNKTHNTSIAKLELKLQDPSINAATRKELENEIYKMKTALVKELWEVNSQEKDLMQKIKAERNKARDEMDVESKIMEREKESPQKLIDKNITEIKRLKAEKKELEDYYVQVIRKIVDLNELNHNRDKALVLTLYEKMKKSYQDSVTAEQNKSKYLCIIS